MTDYGLRCTSCDNIIKFEMNLEGIPKEDPSYGMVIKGISLTCPTCGKRDKHLATNPQDFILGGPDAVVQTPKVMLEEIIKQFKDVGSISSAPTSTFFLHMVEKLEKVKEKLD